MTAEELKQIFGRAVPDRGKLQEIRLRAGKPVLVFTKDAPARLAARQTCFFCSSVR